MKQPFTPNHLIKYLYKETTASESLAISEALNEDPVLQAAHEELLQAYQQLPQVSFGPSAKAIRNILGYSERAALERPA